MDFQNSIQSEETILTDTDMGESKLKKERIDRTSHKYSEDEFRTLSRKEQLKLANTHWMDSKGFDESRMFQFSYSHFSEVCKDLGFVKGVLDTKEDDYINEIDEVKSESMIYIDHGNRTDTEAKKFTLSKSTIDKMDQLLGDGLSNSERSKVIDAIIGKALDARLADKERGQFGVAYRPVAEERLL